MDVANCDKDAFTWNGNDKIKILEAGENSVELRVNMNKNAETDPYNGFIIWSKKNCGIEFLERINDGSITFDIMDTIGYYNSASQNSYYRKENKPSITIGFGNPNPPADSADTKEDDVLGNAKKDQFILSLMGLKSVNEWKKRKI